MTLTQPNPAINHNLFKHIRICNCVLKSLLILAILITVVPNVWADVLIQNDQMYLGDDQTLHIVGEIENNMKVPLKQIEIRAELYSDKGTLLDVESTSSLVDILMPGMKAPFDLMIFGPMAEKITSYRLDLSYEITQPKRQVIDIVSSEISRDALDNLLISGKVVNNGEITANSISIVATLYDKDGNVAAVSQVLKPDYLRADDESFFIVTIPDRSRTYGIVDYSLVAESEEYAAAPEFPIGTGVLLAVSVTAYLALSRQLGRLRVDAAPASGSE